MIDKHKFSSGGFITCPTCESPGNMTGVIAAVTLTSFSSCGTRKVTVDSKPYFTFDQFMGVTSLRRKATSLKRLDINDRYS